MKKIIIYLSVLLISNMYAQCNDYSQTQCSNDNNCEWIEDIETGNCGTLVGDDCELNPECNWNCDFVDDYMGWCTYSCDGGPYEIDNSYCQEIEMPECSEMNQLECSSNGSCDWVEDIDWGSCGDLDPIWNVVYYCDDLSTNSDNCYTYTCYGGGYGQWSTCCGGDPYIIADNSYCEEVEMSECSEMDEFQCSHNFDCDWVEDINSMSCSAFSNENCINQEGCFLDQDCDQWGSWYSWICYDYGPVYCSGNYEQDNSYCEEASGDVQLGDLNDDDVINIQDVIIVVNLVLNLEYNYIADINADLSVNVLDIIELVNIIMN